jgi:hypothetical protein
VLRSSDLQNVVNFSGELHREIFKLNPRTEKFFLTDARAGVAFSFGSRLGRLDAKPENGDSGIVALEILLEKNKGKNEI